MKTSKPGTELTRPMNELRKELERLNKTGIINDQEFLILRKILTENSVSKETYRQFERLFVEKRGLRS